MTQVLTLKTPKMLAHVDEHGIGWVIFNQPERHNALSLEMWQGLADILSNYAGREDVRIAVMRGAGGKAFVSGADISKFESQRSTPEAVAHYNATGAKAYETLYNFPKPTIAKIKGYCFGGGVGT